MLKFQRRREHPTNQTQLLQQQRWRLQIIQLLVCLLLALLLLRLTNLQILHHQYYLAAAAKNCIHNLPIEPIRGLIYDRHGELLAGNRPIFNLCFLNKSFYRPHIAQQLAQLLELDKPTQIAQLTKRMQRARNYETILIHKELTENQLAKFYLHKKEFPGVIIQAELQRFYPKGEIMEAVLGKVGRINPQELQQANANAPANDDNDRKDNNNDEQNTDAAANTDNNTSANKPQYRYLSSSIIGKTGIEKQYETWLRGQLGFQQAEIVVTGQLKRYLQRQPATSGLDLQLTIDYPLQQLAYQALEGEQGAVVAIDPNNGEVLALVSRSDPLNNNNNNSSSNNNNNNHPTKPPRNHKHGGSFNHAIQATFPPASTIKLYYALHALDKQYITPKYQIEDQGWFKLPNNEHIYYDWTRGRGHGLVNVEKAIIESSDTFFYQLAVRMGIKQLDAALTRFGFGAPTGIDLPYENCGLVASPTWKRSKLDKNWYAGDTVLAGIGQGYMLVTPLQQAVAVATIATRGQGWTPHLLLSTRKGDGAPTNSSPRLLTQIQLRDPQIWETVITAMGKVVTSENGTAFRRFKAWECAYQAAGKTGEAQLFRNRDKDKTRYQVIPKPLRNHNWFVTFAPIDKPIIAIAVISEHSNIAVATARKLLDFYLQRQGIHHKIAPTEPSEHSEHNDNQATAATTTALETTTVIETTTKQER